MAHRLYNYRVKNPFFQELSSENKQHLFLHGEEITFPSGHILFYEGEAVNYIYLILKGHVKMSKMTMDHKKFIIHLKGDYDVVGEFSLFNEMRASMTAEVTTSSRILRLEREILEGVFAQNGAIATAFIKLFARNTQSTQAKFSDLLLYGKHGAFYSVLVRLAHSYGVEHVEGIKIDIKLTNQELAHFIGSTRETVNRLFNELRKSNIVSIERGHLIIKEIEVLKKHLQCDKCPVEICTLS
ncbi:Crp/Fnr family transcriptional regulator [Salipaludibacillus agaradhaerens]|uniref:Crp/Fnr family transcriptional regulator n=1 Tax=Salipaludibacillus agaradhaerens TaxID=76935 RepID=A0A9Q4AZX7_SALAG|nr:Crp/Fnr family transcriptional regulator [Salipaludibacillus agaradhaerens]MCR6095774.1 Crp/Fnr family transcriptional regulator [Salipaludibacillus agaradhaerens]MCR6114666.1 Crp/Fnr family transcriptional regulator [Salipaludibacillus agaradhaerens]